MSPFLTNLSQGSNTPRAPRGLIGRQTERARLDRLLQDAGAGRPAGLQVIGEPGIGKTALLDYAAAGATRYRILRMRGFGSEGELPYAGLNMLCAPLLKEIQALPTSQREALTTAVGLAAGPPPERFLVSLATMNLLTSVAARQPVLCIVDDAHWLDQESAQVLAFVARRVQHSALLVLFARPEQQRPTEFDGLAAMYLEPLSSPDARALLIETAPGRVDAAILERILAESRGVPLALVEEFAGVTVGDLAGGYAVPAPRPRRHCADHGCGARASQLSTDARRLLLLAAADPTGYPPLVWRAAARLSIGAEAADRVESAGLMVFGSVVQFTCAGLRSVVYTGATHQERRSSHLALAQAAGADADPDRLAWHLALATSGRDETLAERMERCAPAAYSRGGAAARAAFLEKAAVLTADPVRRADRVLIAAEALHQAGAPEAGRRLLPVAEIAPPDKARRAAVDLRRAQIAFTMRHDSIAARRLLDASRHMERHQPELAGEGYLEALVAAMFAGSHDAGPRPVEVARAARSAVSVSSVRPVDLLLEGLVIRSLAGYVEAISPLKRALAAFERGGLDAQSNRWLWLAGCVAADLWDGRAWTALASTCERLVVGDRATAPAYAPAFRALAELYGGRVDSARACVEHADWVASITGAATFPSPAILLDAWQGRDAVSDSMSKILDEGGHRGDGIALSVVRLSMAVVHNSAGRYDKSLLAARDAAEPDQLALSGWALVELVEAAARSREPEAATRALERLSRRTSAAGTDWALGSEAAARALVADDGDAEPLYLEAIERLACSGITVHLARTQLLYGEWLRRRNRRIDARVPLRAARDVFAAIGADMFADRTHKELLASGETARKRTVETGCQLTPQERRIAYLARDGLTNPEIAARLFVSARTVEYHLHKVFGKLAISSRTALHLVLDAAPAA